MVDMIGNPKGPDLTKSWPFQPKENWPSQEVRREMSRQNAERAKVKHEKNPDWLKRW